MPARAESEIADSLRSPLDLRDCDQEPVHLPGSIQPHGVLIAVDSGHWIVRQVSSNMRAEFGREPGKILGAPLELLLGEKEVAALRVAAAAHSAEGVPHYLSPLILGEKTWERIMHRHAEMIIFEFESWTGLEPSHRELYSGVRTAITELDAAGGLKDFCEVAAGRLRDFAGFDRVMVYRFLEDGSGEVFAEARREDLEPFLGLHYPASDIPQQARALFYKSWLRLLPDTACLPVPMLAAPGTLGPLDMSFTAIRSMSPIHMEYLRNMGVRASMSISIREGGALWGLFACHHYSPRYVPQNTRIACEFLANVLTLKIAGKERDDYQEYRQTLAESNDRIIQAMSQADALGSAFETLSEELLSAIHADGAAISFAGEWFTVGRVLDVNALRRLNEWLDREPERMVFHTRNLAGDAPELGAPADTAAGLLAVRLTKFKPEFVMWFRPEYLHKVSWAGDPSKPCDGDQLNPRKSFAAWTEEVRARSKPWLAVEVEAAKDLQRGIIEIIVRRIEQLTLLNRELDRSNLELDSFAFIAAHDLKEPLQSMKQLTRFVIQDEAPRMSGESATMLETVIHLNDRLDSLLDSLLHYSRVGRMDLSFVPVDLQNELDVALGILRQRFEAGGLEIQLPRKLPTVLADRERISEVLLNLFANAAKYYDGAKDRRWIELTWKLAGDQEGAEPASAMGEYTGWWQFTLRDNGIGIDPQHHERIFQIFQRLHLPTEYGGGSGVGLNIARKVVERHGGRLWVESTPTVGSAFHFTLPQIPGASNQPPQPFGNHEHA